MKCLAINVYCEFGSSFTANLVQVSKTVSIYSLFEAVHIFCPILTIYVQIGLS